MFRVLSNHTLPSLNEEQEAKGEGEARSSPTKIVRRLGCFQVPPNYDYTKSTQWNYARPMEENIDSADKAGENKALSGCDCLSPNQSLFLNIRETRDVAWHGNYTPARQAWQDAFVDSILGPDFSATAIPQKRPWAILTCGAYGAGKGFVRRWMEDNGIIPLSDVVHIDPDYFKTQMPEWKGYITHSPDMAGTLTHRESGYIQEIVTELAMGAHQHVWVDGSLRNVDWFLEFLKNMRQRFPAYQIAILRVFAAEATIVARAEERGKITGRKIPISVLRDSIRAVNPQSLCKLYNYTDIVAHVNNDIGPELADINYGRRVQKATQKCPLPKSWAGLKAAFELSLEPTSNDDDGSSGGTDSNEGPCHVDNAIVDHDEAFAAARSRARSNSSLFPPDLFSSDADNVPIVYEALRGPPAVYQV